MTRRIRVKALLLALTVIVTITGSRQVVAGHGKGATTKASATAASSEPTTSAGIKHTSWDLASEDSSADKDSTTVAGKSKTTTGKAHTTSNHASGGGDANEKDSSPSKGHLHQQTGHAPAVEDSAAYGEEGMKEADYTIGTIDVPEQDVRWSWTIMSLIFPTLMLACTIASKLLVNALGQGGPHEYKYIGVATAAMLDSLNDTVFKIDYIAIINGSSLNRHAPLAWLLVLLVYVSLMVVCTTASDILFDEIQGRGLNRGRHLGLAAVAVLGLVIVVFNPWLFSLNILAYCALLGVVLWESELLMAALNVGGSNKHIYDRHVRVILTMTSMFSLNYFAPVIQPLIDNIVVIVAVLALSMIPSWELALALGGNDAKLVHQLFCALTFPFSGVLGAVLMCGSFKACGCVLALVVLLIPRAMYTRR